MEIGDLVDSVAYGYTDSQWGDLLTSYDGRTITYDGIGNPLNDGVWTYTWKHGRQLTSMSNGSTTWSYTYNADGMRTSRSNGTDTYTYIYNGSRLAAMTKGTHTLYFTYDAAGTPLTVTYDGTKYYYVTNLQGDIDRIITADGAYAVTYIYNAWGELESVTGAMSASLGTLNPLRYRGYVYDHETGLYYLQSRYYNPEWGRFINGDGLVATGQGLLGNNMFAYCNNNPVILYDPSGYCSLILFFIRVDCRNPTCPQSMYYLTKKATSSIPREGVPNSSDVLNNPDGTPKQKRWYGPDGIAERDRDYNHGGDFEFPHDHEWRNGKRQEDHLPPSPDYEFSGDGILGVGVTAACIVGIGWVVLNDVSGIGAVDDAALIPLTELLRQGISNIFK